MGKFWESTGETLSTRLFTNNGPALVFWVWAVTVWTIARSDWDTLTDTIGPWFTDGNAAALLAIAAFAIVVVTASTLVIDRLTVPVLRTLEGYWPSWPATLTNKRTEHWTSELTNIETALLAANDAGNLAEVARLQTKARLLPTNRDDLLPTRIGNTIRAGERRPRDRYGLDPIIVWPQLWLVLPEQPRTDITQARTQLDRSVAAFTWTVISIGLGGLWAPAALIGFIVALAVWRWWIPTAADTYATLLSAIFDTHRFTLYDALHYPRPTTPATEPDLGRRLTRSLWTDTNQAPNAYTHPPAASPDSTTT